MIFFYLPILVLVVNSFNTSRFGGTWEGWSLHWYRQLYRQGEIWHALENSLVIAFTATVVVGRAGHNRRFRPASLSVARLQKFHYTLIYTPLVVPEILMGISLLLFSLPLGMELGLFTIFLAHVTFCISYVTMVVLGRLQDFDYAIVEAAQDLGANWWTTLWRVLLPLLAPASSPAACWRSRLSIDDFVITFFVAGPGSTTLPIRIYSMIKHGSPPLINALFHPVAESPFSASLSARGSAKPRINQEGTMKNNNRLFCAIGSTGAGCLLLLLALPTLHCGKSKQTLHLYTWADYIKPELVQRFENEQNCQVVIDTFDSNEAMYAKLKAGASGYDVIVPAAIWSA